MITDLEEAIRKKLKSQNGYAASYSIERQLIALLVLKYLCDQGKESYPDLIKKGILKSWSYKIDEYAIFANNIPTNLLALIQYENLEDLVQEYLKQKKSRLNIVNKGLPKLAFCSHFNKETYDPTGNTTYIINKFNVSISGLFNFKFFDLILGNNNQYLLYDQINFANYNYVYVYDRKAKFNFIHDNENSTFDLVWRLLKKNANMEVILDTDYSKVAVIKNALYLLNKIAKIILFNDDTTYVYFNNLTKDTISIINCSNASMDKLEQIIKLNRKQKDVLVKVTPEDIRQNNYRLGFKLYQTEMKGENKSINELVDENTKLVDLLANINQDIELELNKLINK